MVGMASSSYSQQTKFTLHYDNISVGDLLKTIEGNSEFIFIYSRKTLDLNRKVQIIVDGEDINSVLQQALPAKYNTYEIKDRQVIIKAKTEKKIPARGNLTEALPVLEQEIQGRLISGNVTDASGLPLPGVTIMIKGTSKGTISDVDGNYSIADIPSTGVTLIFSFMGMKTQEVAVGNMTRIDIRMEEDAVGLDEVIAVGYGTTTKRSTTAAVSKISTEDILNLPVSSIGDALGGRTAGLIVTNSGGGIGAQPSVTVRGGGSPILVIDGVTTSNMDEMHRMNPKDIESLTVLKDAEAVAIYGSKGGNGAIVITTKRGEEGKMNINYGYCHNFSQPTVLPKKLNSYEMVMIKNAAATYDGQELPYSEDIVQKFKDQSDPYNYPDVDWQDEVLNNFAQENRHDLSLVGGDEKTQYFASLSYFDQGSLYKFDTNWLKRYTYRMSLSNNFEKVGLKATLSFFGNVQKTRAPYSFYSTNYAQTWGHIQNTDPMNLAYNDLGLYYSESDHPIVEIDPSSGYDRNDNRNVNGQLNVEWDIPKVDGLQFKFLAYYRNDNDFNKKWRVNANQYSLGSDVPEGKNLPNLSLYSSSGWQYRVQPLLTYNKVFNKHAIEALVGYDETYWYSEFVEASRENFELDVDQIFAGPTETAKNNGGESEGANAGYVGRLKYGFNNKYMLEGSIRIDGNDNFPKDERWGIFYSGSAGWVVTEENFMESFKKSLKMNFFKLRFSYGETGLDDGVDRYEYLPGYKLIERGYVIDGKVVPGFDEGALVSRDITWYERRSVNTGVDFAFFGNKVSGSFDYFFYETTNFLGSPSGSNYSDPLGASLPKVNTEGNHRRAGWEFDLKYKNHLGELYYDIGANCTYFDQLWVNKYDESENVLLNPRTRETHQRGYGSLAYISEGFYQDAWDVMNSPKRNSSYNLVAGDIKYQDVNGDGQIDGEDQVRSGKPSFPRLMYGFTVDLRYKAWSAGMHFQGTGSRHVYLEDRLRNTKSKYIVYPFQKDYWMPNNTEALYPRLITDETLNGNNNGVTSNFWLISARYFRMKSLQVNYDFKQKLFRTLPFSRFDVFVSGTNLFTISKLYSKYKMDPETSSANNYGYPLQRVFSLGVNVGF